MKVSILCSCSNHTRAWGTDAATKNPARRGHWCTLWHWYPVRRPVAAGPPGHGLDCPTRTRSRPRGVLAHGELQESTPGRSRPCPMSSLPRLPSTSEPLSPGRDVGLVPESVLSRDSGFRSQRRELRVKAQRHDRVGRSPAHSTVTLEFKQVEFKGRGGPSVAAPACPLDHDLTGSARAQTVGAVQVGGEVR